MKTALRGLGRGAVLGGLLGFAGSEVFSAIFFAFDGFRAYQIDGYWLPISWGGLWFLILIFHVFIVFSGILFGILIGAVVGSILVLLDLMKWQRIGVSVLIASLLHQGIAKAMLWQYGWRPNRRLAELINSYGENRLIIWIIILCLAILFGIKFDSFRIRWPNLFRKQIGEG